MSNCTDYPKRVYQQKVNDIITEDVLNHPFIADPQQSVLFEKIEETLKLVLQIVSVVKDTTQLNKPSQRCVPFTTLS
jgi:hypothetical protein